MKKGAREMSKESPSKIDIRIDIRQNCFKMGYNRVIKQVEKIIESERYSPEAPYQELVNPVLDAILEEIKNLKEVGK